MSASEPSPSTALASPGLARSARRSAVSDRGRYDGIRRLAPAELVREAELDQDRSVAGTHTSLGLERGHGRRRAAPARPRERPVRERRGTRRPARATMRARRGRRRRGSRGRAPPQPRRPRESSFAVPRRAPVPPTCVLCARSPGWAGPRTGRSAGMRSRSHPRRRRSGCSARGCRARAGPRGSVRTRTRRHGARCP